MAIVASARVPGFTPSVNGLHFANAFPHQPDLEIPIPMLGTVPIGDASNGVCGGMVYTVRDVFETPGLAPVAATQPPPADSPLFKYIVRRLVMSFGLPLGVARYYQWMLAPDADRGWLTSLGWLPFFKQRGLAWRTIKEEWPRNIKPDLDAGRLCCLGLIAVASSDPEELGHNHQVMAYGYDLEDDQTLTLRIYDPNTPPDQADAVYIKLGLRQPTKTAAIEHNILIGGRPIRGFFRVGYEYSNPTGKLG